MSPPGFGRGDFDDQRRTHSLLRHIERAPVLRLANAKDHCYIGAMRLQVLHIPGDAYIVEDD